MFWPFLNILRFDHLCGHRGDICKQTWYKNTDLTSDRLPRKGQTGRFQDHRTWKGSLSCSTQREYHYQYRATEIKWQRYKCATAPFHTVTWLKFFKFLSTVLVRSVFSYHVCLHLSPRWPQRWSKRKIFKNGQNITCFYFKYMEPFGLPGYLIVSLSNLI